MDQRCVGVDGSGPWTVTGRGIEKVTVWTDFDLPKVSVREWWSLGEGYDEKTTYEWGSARNDETITSERVLEGTDGDRTYTCTLVGDGVVTGRLRTNGRNGYCHNNGYLTPVEPRRLCRPRIGALRSLFFIRPDQGLMVSITCVGFSRLDSEPGDFSYSLIRLIDSGLIWCQFS